MRQLTSKNRFLVKSGFIGLVLLGSCGLGLMPGLALAATALPGAASEEMSLGAKAIDERRYEDAVAAFSRALDSETLDAETQALAHHHRGIALQRLGQFKDAVADYDYAINSKALPNAIISRTYYNRAIAHGELNDPTAAEADYDLCLAAAPGFAAAYHNRANLERRRGAYADAINDYSAAIARLPEYAQKLSLYGRALAKQETADLEGAKLDLELALRRDPEFQLARDKLAELYASNDVKTAAIAPKVLPEKPQLPQSDVIRVASSGGWETTAVRFENGTPIHLSDAAPKAKPSSVAKPTATATPTKVASLPAPAEPPATPAAVVKELKPSQEASEDKPEAKTKAVAPISASTSTGKYRLQLGAFRSEDVALGQWKNLSGKASDELDGRSPQVERADLGDKGIYYRLQTSGYKTAAEAKSTCAALKSRSIDCIVVVR